MKLDLCGEFFLKTRGIDPILCPCAHFFQRVSFAGWCAQDVADTARKSVPNFSPRRASCAGFGYSKTTPHAKLERESFDSPQNT